MRKAAKLLYSNLVVCKNHLANYVIAINLSFIWSMGSLLGFCIAMQIITGIFLSFFYNSDTNYAFFSVERIMQAQGCYKNS